MRTPTEDSSLSIQTLELKKAALFFRAINHPLRQQMLKLLHRKGEMIVTDIYVKLRLQQSVASQHLAILRAKQIVVNRKSGNQVFYSLRDPVLSEVLELLRRYFYSQLSGTVTMLEQVEQEAPRTR